MTFTKTKLGRKILEALNRSSFLFPERRFGELSNDFHHEQKYLCLNNPQSVYSGNGSQNNTTKGNLLQQRHNVLWWFKLGKSTAMMSSGSSKPVTLSLNICCVPFTVWNIRVTSFYSLGVLNTSRHDFPHYISGWPVSGLTF